MSLYMSLLLPCSILFFIGMVVSQAAPRYMGGYVIEGCGFVGMFICFMLKVNGIL